MRIIILNRLGRAASCIDFTRHSSWVAGTVAMALFAGAVTLGYALAASQEGKAEVEQIAALRAEIASQREALTTLRATADEQINALALRMGDLNANVIRLNALGGRLTDMAKLDDGEFDFANAPAVGGPAEEAEPVAAEGQLPQLLSDVNTLEATLEQQTLQLAALEGLMLNRKLDERVRPKGRPVKSGWISSFFGRRTDPITGKAAYHKGVDFAGKTGSEVIAVGDGVVTWSGRRSGFGNMVEIKHGSGYVTRYAHNQVNLVAVGDRVSQGQTIALMGSTGRSTGSHLHFEVLQDGRVQDPGRFVRGG